MNKSTLRENILTSLKRLEPGLHQEQSIQIHKKIMSNSNVKKAQLIGITLSSFPEVDTWNLIELLWAEGKRIAIPKCNSKTRGMVFYEIDSFNHLEVVYMNLKEPIPAFTKKVTASHIDVLIVPGIVFDNRGYRIGFGGGYYDRYLSDYHGTTISLAFDLQLVNGIPKEGYDIPVDIILTETKQIQCAKME